MWSQMVAQESISLVTSYTRSNLPKDSDLHRLKELSGALYLTTVREARPPRREKVVEQYIKSIARDRKIYQAELGHIQIRSLGGNSFSVGLSSCAHQI